MGNWLKKTPYPNPNYGKVKKVSTAQVPLNAADAKKYLVGGNALFTLQNPATEVRFTFKVRTIKDQENSPYFIKVLTGTEESYTYIGYVKPDNLGKFIHSGKKGIGLDAPSVQYI